MQKSQKSQNLDLFNNNHVGIYPTYSHRNQENQLFFNNQQYLSADLLVQELQFLLSHQEVLNHMGNSLYQRVQNVLAVTQAQQHQKQLNEMTKKNIKNENILQEISNININKQKNIKLSTNKSNQIQKIKQENKCISQKKNNIKNNKNKNILLSNQNNDSYQFKEQIYQKKKLFTDKNIDNTLANKNKQKNIQLINHQSQKKLIQVQPIPQCKKYKTKFKVITQVPINPRNSNQNMKSAKSSTSKSRDKKLIKSQSMGKLQRCKIKFGTLNINKQKINQKILPCVNITTDTIKDNKFIMKQLKLKLDTYSHNHFKKKCQDKSFRKLHQSKQIYNQKINKIQPEIIGTQQNYNGQNKYPLPNTNTDYQQRQSQQKQKLSQSNKIQKTRTNIKKQFNATIQFMQQIGQLQKQTQDQQQILQQSIKWIKNQINYQKSYYQTINKNILMIKQQINNININITGISKKKKFNHIKLQGIWNQVKQLNDIIIQTKKQHEEVKINLDQQAELMRMYTKVIQQLKQQLKIEMQSRDSVKSRLKQSKKSEYALKLKMKTAKQKNDLILGVVRESLSKWKG